MNDEPKSKWRWRVLFYGLGSVILAIGITLNTKTLLGVSPVISIPYTMTAIWGWNFGLMTFCSYVIFVILQLILQGKNRQWRVLIQLPFSFVFSLLLVFFNRVLNFHFHSIWEQLAFLMGAIAITDLGVFLMVNMRLIPNPADGLAQAIGDFSGRNLGFGKNVLDFCSVGFSLTVGLIATGSLVSLGLGTIIAMIGVGRFIALYNFFFREKIERLAGISLVPQQKTCGETC